MSSQGKRVRLKTQFRGNLKKFSSIYRKGKKGSASTADMISIGDSWLNYAIKEKLIEPMKGIEDQDWYKGLSDKWKDWSDLWRPELAGKISMVNSPIGAVLKDMGASYNTTDLDSQVPGGKIALEKNLSSLMKQVFT